MNEIFEDLDKSNNVSFDNLNDCTINLERAEKNQIVFYKNRNDQRSVEVFKNRLSGSNPGLLILTNKPTFEIAHPFIIVTEGSFLGVQKKVLEKLFPLKKVPKIAAVTGTNGKTTTAFLLMQLIQQKGLSVGFAGTIGVYKNSSKIPHEFSTTSPSFIDLWKLIFKNNDLNILCLEASSHALDQDRFYGFEFDVVSFTNFTRDHLDYHHSFDSYFDAKKRILHYLKKEGKCFLSSSQGEIFEKLNDSRAQKVDLLEEPVGNLFFQVKYNLENLTLAQEMANHLLGRVENYDLQEIIPPPGRLDLVKIREDFIAAIDFAHTPDAVENVIKEVRVSFPSFRVVVVFGCGGNRDRKKRELMGEIVSGLSDFFYITNDNPRDESPDEIIEDIKVGVIKNSSFVVEKDRKKAINTALHSVESNSIVLILGKGHEDYQIVKGKKSYFNDKEIVLEFLKNDEN